MVDLADKPFLGLTPPEEPREPIAPIDTGYPARLRSALLSALIVGPLGGGVVGGIVGMGVGMLAGSFWGGYSLESRNEAFNNGFLFTITLFILVTSLWLFSSDLKGDPRDAMAREEAQKAYGQALLTYRANKKIYDKAMQEWPQELERRKAYNASITQAKQAREMAVQKERERLAREEKWKQDAARAYAVLQSWRGEFLAECVAKYGPRDEAELTRLYVEAFPFSPVAQDPRAGCLHYYANSYPIIAAVKHLLPTEIPKP